MPRQLKPQEVTSYEHKSGTTVAIYLDRNDLTFFATPGDARLEAPSRDELVQKVRAYLDASTRVEWFPILTVTAVEDRDPHRSQTRSYRSPEHGGLALAVGRSHVGRNAQGQWRSVRWEEFRPDDDAPDADIRRLARSQGFYMQGMMRPSHLRPHEQWDEPPHGDYGPGLPYTYESDGRSWLPYDETLYTTLLGMIDGLHRVREQVQELVTTARGREALRRMAAMGDGLPLLGAPAPAAEG